MIPENVKIFIYIAYNIKKGIRSDFAAECLVSLFKFFKNGSAVNNVID